MKIAAAAAYSVMVAVAGKPDVLVAAVAISAALLCGARLPWRGVAGRLLVANSFVGLLWLVLPWSTAGEPLARLGPVTVTRPGVAQAILITLKCNAIVIAMIALLGTSSIFELARGLGSFGVPKKLLMVVFFGFRYAQVIQGEYDRLSDASKVRGFRPRTNLHTYRTYASLLGMILVRSHDRSVRIHQAMLCRGFRGEYPLARSFRLRSGDWLIGGLLFAATALLGLLEWRMTT